MTMQLISTTTVGVSGASSVSFSSIPQTYTDLYLTISGRTNAAAVQSGIYLTVNGAVPWSFAQVVGTGSASTTNSGTDGYLGNMSASTATANTFGIGSIYFPNYRALTSKPYDSEMAAETNAAAINMFITNGFITSSSHAAITSLAVNASASSFVQYSTVSLYGII